MPILRHVTGENSRRLTAIWKDAEMSRRHIPRYDEPSLPEIFAEPIIQALMARAGITRIEMEGLLGAVRGKLARRQAETEHRAG
jgi:hypothetical protein